VGAPLLRAEIRDLVGGRPSEDPKNDLNGQGGLHLKV
jgi:hypothetical protein